MVLCCSPIRELALERRGGSSQSFLLSNPDKPGLPSNIKNFQSPYCSTDFGTIFRKYHRTLEIALAFAITWPANPTCQNWGVSLNVSVGERESTNELLGIFHLYQRTLDAHQKLLRPGRPINRYNLYAVYYTGKFRVEITIKPSLPWWIDSNRHLPCCIFRRF